MNKTVTETLEQLRFINEIDFRSIHENSLKYPDYYLRHDSTIQRLVNKILNKEYYHEILKSNNILQYVPLLEKIHFAIYEKYHSKNHRNSEIANSNLIAIFNEIEKSSNLTYSEGWEYNGMNKTIRKFGEKLFTSEVNYYFEPNFSFNNSTRKKVTMIVENTKGVFDKNNSVQNNHYWLIGDSYQSEGFSNRIYFNISPSLVNFDLFLNDIQNWLNFRSIPFKLKFPNNINGFIDYTDNTVLYFQRENTLQVFEIVKRIELKYAKVQLFDSESPMFTKVLFQGVSFGESPDNEVFTSFGSYRSAILSFLIVEELIKSNFLSYSININQIFESITVLNFFKNPEKTLDMNKDFGVGVNWLDRFYTNQFSVYDYSSHFYHYSSFKPEFEIPFKEDTFLFGAYKVATIIWNEAYFFPGYGEEELYVNWFQCTKNLEDKQGFFGFQYESMDSTYEDGILGVLYFLKNFHNVYQIEFNSSIFKAAALNYRKQSDSFSLKAITSSNKIDEFFSKDFIISLKLLRLTSNPILDLIDKVVFADCNLNYDEKELSKILLSEITNGKVFENFISNSEPNMSLGYGYSLLGYFFLRLHSPLEFPSINAEIAIIKPEGEPIEDNS